MASRIGAGPQPGSLEYRQGKLRSACTHPRRQVLRKQRGEGCSIFKRSSKKKKKPTNKLRFRSPERWLILLLSHLFLHLPHAPQVLHQQEASQEREIKKKKKNQAIHAPVGSPATSCLWDRTLQIRLVWQMHDRATSVPAPLSQTQQCPACSLGKLVCIQTYQTQLR